MGIITRMRKQTCVYWELASADSAGEDYDDHGQPQFLDPVELTVRWDDRNVEYTNPDGIKQWSKSQVYTGQDIRRGEALMLGTLLDVTEAIDILINDGAMQVKGFDKIPNLKATEFLRIAYL